MSNVERTQGQGERDAGAVPAYHTERKRTKVRQHRSKLAVFGKDSEFEYRWILDTHDSGVEVQRRMSDDWVLVRSDEVEGIGEDSVWNSEFAGGSIVRRNAGSDGQFYYLMKIRKTWYDEDRAAEAKEIDEREDIILGRNVGDGYDDNDTYDAISGVRGMNKPSRVTGVTQGGKPT